MICAPDHIKKYIKQIVGKNKYFNYFIDTPYTFAYEIVCDCGGNTFTVYKNSEPTVTAVCAMCGKTITLYDLTQYPCAVALGLGEELKKVTNEKNDKFHVAIVFEYSDEFAFDDKEFDENDITWCQIYIYDTVRTQSIMIVDDETA